MISESQVKEIVADVLRQRFAKEDIIESNVAFEEDFDGEQVVRVTAHFEHHAVTALALFAASDEIRSRLRSAGDERFVFIRQEIQAEACDDFGDENALGRPN